MYLRLQTCGLWPHTEIYAKQDVILCVLGPDWRDTLHCLFFLAWGRVNHTVSLKWLLNLYHAITIHDTLLEQSYVVLQGIQTVVLSCLHLVKYFAGLILHRGNRPYLQRTAHIHANSCLPFCVTKRAQNFGAHVYASQNNAFFAFWGSPFRLCTFWCTKWRTWDACVCALHGVNRVYCLHAPDHCLEGSIQIHTYIPLGEEKQLM